jgi:hypothetical protein
MSKSLEKPNQPKSLTTEQRMLVDKLIAHIGERHVMVKRKALHEAVMAVSTLSCIPGWIGKNLKVRHPEKRAIYDLSKLLKLPVVAFKETKKKKKIKKIDVPVVEENISSVEEPLFN